MSNVLGNVWLCSYCWRWDTNRTPPQNVPCPLTFEHVGVGCLLKWRQSRVASGIDYIEWRSVGSARRAVNTGRGVSTPERSDVLNTVARLPAGPWKLLINATPGEFFLNYLDFISLCSGLLTISYEESFILCPIFRIGILWPKLHIVYF